MERAGWIPALGETRHDAHRKVTEVLRTARVDEACPRGTVPPGWRTRSWSLHMSLFCLVGSCRATRCWCSESRIRGRQALWAKRGGKALRVWKMQSQSS